MLFCMYADKVRSRTKYLFQIVSVLTGHITPQDHKNFYKVFVSVLDLHFQAANRGYMCLYFRIVVDHVSTDLIVRAVPLRRPCARVAYRPTCDSS